MQYYLSTLLFLCLLHVDGCLNTQSSTIPTEAAVKKTTVTTNRKAAVRAAWGQKEWLIIASGKTNKDEEHIYSLANKITAFHPFEKQLTAVKRSDVNQQTLANSSIIFIGNHVDSILWHSLGADNDGNFRNINFMQPEYLLRAVNMQNPWAKADSSIAMQLIFMDDVYELENRLKTHYAKDNWKALFSGQYDYSIYEGEEARLLGFFSNENWKADLSRELIFNKSEKAIYEDQDIRLFAPDGAPSPAQIQMLATSLVQKKKQLEEWFSFKASPLLEVNLYPNLERITLRRKHMSEVQLGVEKQQLHLTVDDFEQNLNSSEFYYSLLKWFRVQNQQELATQSAYIDRGLSVLMAHNGIPAAIQQDNFVRNNCLDTEGLRTVERNTFGSYLYDYSAAAALLNITADKRNQHLKLSQIPVQLFRATDTKPSKDTKPLVFQRGMTLAHEGYNVVNGYGGHTVNRSLDSLATLGVNSIAVVPYSYQSSPNRVGQLPVVDSPGTENNGASRSAIRRAHKRNWSVMLKPQIWVGHNSWPGDIDFTTQEAWDQWFSRYTEWILNYAIMAEIESVYSLCIGTELRHTTLKQPDQWRKLISAIRAVYSGQLTYAANWGEEFEQLSFWDDLDVIGLNSYYPLSKSATATDDVLRQGVKKWVDMAEQLAKKADKRWWLTEVGFRSVTSPWLNPHAAPLNRKEDQVAQSRCFEALVYNLKQTKHLNGVYVWKWPSELDNKNWRYDGDVRFTPRGKPAATVLKAYYNYLINANEIK